MNMALIQETPAGETFSLASFDSIRAAFVAWFNSISHALFSPAAMWQALAVVAAASLAFLLSRFPIGRLKKLATARPAPDMLFRLYKSLARVVWPVFMVILLWITTVVFNALALPNEVLRIAASLLNAWIIVRVITSNMKEGFWSTALAFLAWTIAALYILRLLDPVTESLDATSVQVGGTRFTLLSILTSSVFACIALWGGRIAGDAAQASLRNSRNLTPSLAGLLGQVAKIAMMITAVIIALNVAGVPLTGLTIFSGALGVGIGFGSQAIFSNLISGVIILMEKSVKVGDFIELQSGVTGEIREINIRSTLLTTNDNVDILIPNEEFIKAQVINWTLKEARRRTHVKFGVAYGTDKELVRKAGLEAASEVEWTYDDGGARRPQVWLVGFGDSSLDFELVVWLNEKAVSRPGKVQADYNWALHSALERHGIEIPFPQRDLNIKAAEPVRVKLEPND